MNDFSRGKFVNLVAVGIGLVVGMYVIKSKIAAPERKPPPRRISTRTVPMMVANLKPGMVVSFHDLGMGPWPANEIAGDVLLGAQAIVGRVVKEEIKAATPIHASSLCRAGEYSKEYVGVP
jgi:Flp pilus assembly protein CpaB